MVFMFIGSLSEVVQSVLTQMISPAPTAADATTDPTAVSAPAHGLKPPWDERRKAWVFRPTRIILGVLWAVLLLFGAAAGVVSYMQFPLVLACGLGAIAVAAGVGLLLWRKSVLLVDRSTIVSRAMLGLRTFTMHHDEVVDVQYSHMLRSFVIIDASGQRVYFSTWVRGVRQVLKDMAIRPAHLRLAASNQALI